MCCIAICKNKNPSLETLEEMEKDNRDGAGIMYLIGKGKTAYQKGLTAKQVYDFINTTKPKFPYVIHFRESSIGTKDPLLTHPFEITRKSELRLNGKTERLLCHNGTFIDWKILMAGGNIDVPEKELMSDTRGIAMVLSTHYYSYNLLNKLPGYWVVMDGKNQLVRHFGDFKEHSENPGILFSNLYWSWRTSRQASYPGYSGHYQGYWDGCEWQNGNDTRTYAQVQREKELAEEKKLQEELQKELSKPENQPDISQSQLPTPKIKLSKQDKKRLRRQKWLAKLASEDCEYMINHNPNPISNKDLNENNDNSADKLIELNNLRIHESPPTSFFKKMSDNTRKILGWPVDVDHIEI